MKGECNFFSEVVISLSGHTTAKINATSKPDDRLMAMVVGTVTVSEQHHGENERHAESREPLVLLADNQSSKEPCFHRTGPGLGQVIS